jgi:hypothetical protein
MKKPNLELFSLCLSYLNSLVEDLGGEVQAVAMLQPSSAQWSVWAGCWNNGA